MADTLFCKGHGTKRPFLKIKVWYTYVVSFIHLSEMSSNSRSVGHIRPVAQLHPAHDKISYLHQATCTFPPLNHPLRSEVNWTWQCALSHRGATAKSSKTLNRYYELHEEICQFLESKGKDTTEREESGDVIWSFCVTHWNISLLWTCSFQERGIFSLCSLWWRLTKHPKESSHWCTPALHLEGFQITKPNPKHWWTGS